MQILYNFGIFEKTYAAMARPPGLVSDGVAWPEVVALQAQVKSKERSSRGPSSGGFPSMGVPNSSMVYNGISQFRWMI